MKTIEIHHGGYRYHYRRLESPSSEYAPVMLVGGAFQSMDSMRRFAEFFLQRTSVILVDPPGAGNSDPSMAPSSWPTVSRRSSTGRRSPA